MKYQLEPQLKTVSAQRLYKALAEAKSPQQVANLLRDLLTLEELTEATRRFETAQLLTKGDTVRSIAKQLDTSSATVSRVNHWIHHGTGGYRDALHLS